MTSKMGTHTLVKGLLLLCIIALAVGLGLCAGLAPLAQAATFTVDRTDDDAAAMACDAAGPNDCSLRGAILAANERPLSETSTINVPAGTYVLSQSSSCTYKHQGTPFSFTSSEVPLCVAKNVTLQGAGAATTIIDGNQAHRVFFISADATVQLGSVTIAHGLGDRSFDLNPHGGGIVNEGTLTLTDSVVRTITRCLLVLLMAAALTIPGSSRSSGVRCQTMSRPAASWAAASTTRRRASCR